MQRLEVSGVVRPIYGSLGVKRLKDWMSICANATHVKRKRLILLPELELAYLQFASTLVSYPRVCRQVWLFKQITVSNSSSQQNLLHVLKQSLTSTQHLSSESAATLVYLLNRCMAQILIVITRDSRITRIMRHSCLLTPFWVLEFIFLTQMLP